MYKDSWKNKNVFIKQLELNKKEFLNYPEHWNVFIKIISNLIINTSNLKLLDIGCGCGSYYKLCQDNFKNNLFYVGIDYSNEAIDLAKTTWNYSNFYCKDLFELNFDFIKNFDIIHLGALLDVLENADEALNFILSFKIKYIYIGRIDIKNDNKFIKIYEAYDEINTYKYIHSYSDFLKIIDMNGYQIIEKINNNILLEYKND